MSVTLDNKSTPPTPAACGGGGGGGYKTDYVALNQFFWGKKVAEHAAQRAKPRFEAAMEAEAHAYAMARPPVLAEPCAHVVPHYNPRYVYQGFLMMIHMDLFMFRSPSYSSDERHDCVSIYYDKETGGALLDYTPQTDCPGMGVTHGMYVLPAGATIRDIVRTFCGTDCEIGYTCAWKGERKPRIELLAKTMDSLSAEYVASPFETHVHVTHTTPLRSTRGQIVNGVVVN